MKRRVVSGILAFLMVVSLVGQKSYAAEITDVQEETTQVTMEVPETEDESVNEVIETEAVSETAAVEDTTVSEDASQTEEEAVSQVGTFDEFGMAISALQHSMDSELTDSGDSIDSLSWVSRNVMVEARVSGLTFAELCPQAVIAGPENNYYLAFASEAEAAAAVSALEAREDIVYAEQDFVEQGDEAEEKAPELEKLTDSGDGTGSFHSWGVKYTGFHLYAQKYATTNSVTVAVIDSGVDKNHADLKPYLTSAEYDYVDGDSNAMDVHGHGTSVAGIVVDCAAGMNVKIMPIRVLNADNKGTASGTASGIRYAADHGASIINLSLGGEHAAAKESAINYAIEKGCIVVASAGNGSKSTDDYCPAHIADVITVSSIDAEGKIASYSNYGNAVDFAAPGENIEACKLGGGYRDFSGTSAAAAHMSAYAAMIKLRYPNHSLEQVTTHTKIWCDDAGAEDYDTHYGYGIINAGDEAGYAKTTYHITDGVADIIDWPVRDSNMKYTLLSTIPIRVRYSFQGWKYTKDGEEILVQPGGTRPMDYGMKFTAKWIGGTTTIDGDKQYYWTVVDNTTTPDGTYYRYTPTQSGTYVIQSNSLYDTEMTAYNLDGDELFSDDDSGVYQNFRKEAYLTAGETYLFHVYQYQKRPAKFQIQLYKKSLPEYSVNYYMTDGKKTFTTCTSLNATLLRDPKEKKLQTQSGWARTADSNTAEFLVDEVYTSHVNIDLYPVWREPDLIDSVPKSGKVYLNDYHDYKSYRFVVPVSGSYQLSFQGSDRLMARVYNMSGNVLESNQGSNITLDVDLMANQVYYIYLTHEIECLDEGEFSLTLTGADYAHRPLTVNEEWNSLLYKMQLANYYSFTAPSAGTYVVYSTGSTDVLVQTYSNADHTGNYAEDDDSGVGYNFSLEMNLAAGETRYMRVCGARSSSEGAYSIFVKKQCTLTYNANGGSGAPTSQTALSGDSVTLSTAVPTRSGYTFDGWYTAASSGAKVSGTIRLPYDVTLYAHWSSNGAASYSIKYSANGGTGAPSAQTKTQGTTLKLRTGVPTREGYVFLGWATAKNAATAQYQPGGSFNVDADTTLYAVWEIECVKLVNGTAKSAVLASGANDIYKFTAASAGEYVFLSKGDIDTYGVLYEDGNLTTILARDDNSGTSKNFKMTYTMTAGQTVYLKVRGVGTAAGDYSVRACSKYTVTFNANGGSGAPADQEKLKGSSITLTKTVPTRAGFTFLGWATAKTAAAAEYQPGGTFAVNADTTLYAVWEQASVAITNGGAKTGTIASGKYDTYKFTAASEGTYGFFSVGTVDTYGVLYDDMGLTTILARDDNSGEDKNFKLTYAMTAGQTVYLKVRGVGTAAGDYTVRVGLKYTVKYSANGGTGAPSAQEKFKGYTLTLASAQPTKEGYIFMGWATSKTSSVIEYKAGAKFSLNADTTLYAVWGRESTPLTNGVAATGTVTSGANTIFRFTAASAGEYSFFTRGSVDTYGALYEDATLSTVKLRDDNSGEGKNFRIDYTMAAGQTIYVKVRGVGTAEGSYTIKACRRYAITYDANGGSGAPAAQEKFKGSSVALTKEVPTRSGYTFLGWATSKSATAAEYQPGGSFSVNEDTTLYAVWKKA